MMCLAGGQVEVSAFSHGLRHSQSTIYRFQISLVKASGKCPHVVAGSIMNGNESRVCMWRGKARPFQKPL